MFSVATPRRLQEINETGVFDHLQQMVLLCLVILSVVSLLKGELVIPTQTTKKIGKDVKRR